DEIGNTKSTNQQINKLATPIPPRHRCRGGRAGSTNPQTCDAEGGIRKSTYLQTTQFLQRDYNPFNLYPLFCCTFVSFDKAPVRMNLEALFLFLQKNYACRQNSKP